VSGFEYKSIIGQHDNELTEVTERVQGELILVLPHSDDFSDDEEEAE